MGLPAVGIQEITMLDSKPLYSVLNKKERKRNHVK